MSVRAALEAAERELAAAGCPSPRVDAELLVAHVLALTRTGVYVEPDRTLLPDEEERLTALLGRRAEREPLPYVLGEWGFRRLTLAVDPRVLIPRPETEIVVERCLALLAESAEPRVLDIGVGSGAIALAIADEHPGALVTATDSSEEALAVAAENLARSGLDGRVELVAGELFAGLEGPFELVVSNPPYVAAADLEGLEPEIRDHEPREALLDRGAGRELERGARAVLAPGGALVLEVGDGQAPDVARRIAGLGYDAVRVTPDLTGRERVVEGRWHGR